MTFSTGVTTSTASRMTFGAGVLYRDYGEDGEEMVGATDGGAVLRVERRDRDVPVDGLPGPAQGLVRSVRTDVTLDVTLVELSAKTKRELLRGPTTTEGSRTVTGAESGIEDGDYLTNLALVLESWEAEGDRQVFVLRDVLVGTDGWRRRFRDAGAGSVRVRATAHLRTPDQSADAVLSEVTRAWADGDSVHGRSGVTAATSSRMTFGAGALYRNYGSTGQELIGATRGGASLEVDRRNREVRADGAHGATRGLVRTVRTVVTLRATLAELSAATKEELLRGSGDIATGIGDYLTNVALVADSWEDGGTREVVILENVIPGFGGWTLRTRDARGGDVDVTFRAHYRTSDLDDVPFQDGLLAALLRDWDPAEDLSGQTLTERIHGRDATLGSTTGTDVNDPTWVASPPSLSFGEDDYVKQADDLWVTG